MTASRALLATNRGHGHANRKLARDSTVEFAIALDHQGPVECEPTGDKEALLHRPVHLPAGESVTVDLLVSGAFTGWRGDPGTFQHWLGPALEWFRSVDLDHVEQATAQEWDAFIEPVPNIHFPRPSYAVSLRRSTLAAALHADARWGAVAAGFDRGLNAYCLPRVALWAGGAFERLGHVPIGRKVFQWLAATKGQKGPYSYWFQKYSIDGYPEWETPAVDQTALIPWRLEQHYERTGDADFVAACWPMVERAASVCGGNSGHPGLRMLDDLSLVSSAGVWDSRFGAFLYSNACIVAGLRAASRLAKVVDREESAAGWSSLADRIWHEGILREPVEDRRGPGMVDPDTGRFFDARRLSTLRGLWTDRPEYLVEHSAALDISLLGPAVPFGLLEAGDPRLRRCAEGIFRHNLFAGESNLLTLWAADPARSGADAVPGEGHKIDLSPLASLWMARYLLQLGRETGEGRHWNLAVSMLDGILGRLSSLGLAVRPAPRTTEPPRLSLGASGVWELHAMLVETMLDLAGLDYNAPARRIRLSPTLPGSWPSIGMGHRFPCGEVGYRLDRPVGGTVHRLSLRAKLDHPVLLDIDLTCPDLDDLGPWNAAPSAPRRASSGGPAGSAGPSSCPPARPTASGPGAEKRPGQVPRGGGSRRNSSRRRSISARSGRLRVPDAAEPAANDDAPLEVVAEEGVTHGARRRVDFAADTIVGVDHLQVKARAVGRLAEIGQHRRERPVARQQEGRSVVAKACDRRRVKVCQLLQSRGPEPACHMDLNRFQVADREGLDLDLEVDQVLGPRGPGRADAERIPVRWRIHGLDTVEEDLMTGEAGASEGVGIGTPGGADPVQGEDRAHGMADETGPRGVDRQGPGPARPDPLVSAALGSPAARHDAAPMGEGASINEEPRRPEMKWDVGASTERGRMIEADASAVRRGLGVNGITDDTMSIAGRSRLSSIVSFFFTKVCALFRDYVGPDDPGHGKLVRAGRNRARELVIAGLGRAWIDQEAGLLADADPDASPAGVLDGPNRPAVDRAVAVPDQQGPALDAGELIDRPLDLEPAADIRRLRAADAQDAARELLLAKLGPAHRARRAAGQLHPRR